jgi:hypothetical protein
MAYTLSRLSQAMQDTIITSKPENQTFSNSPVLKLMLDSNSIKLKGGETIKEQVYLNATALGGAYDGFQVLETDPQDPYQEPTWQFANYHEPIMLGGLEQVQNQGKDKIFDLMTSLKDIALSAMRDKIATHLFDDGGLDTTGGTMFTGLEAAIDDTTNHGTYAGLSRTTYANWCAKYYANGGVARAYTYKLINRSLSGTQFNNRTANTGVVGLAGFSKFKELLQGQQRYNDNKKLASMGFTAMLFEERDLVADEYCPAGTFYWLSLNPEDLYFAILSDRNFHLREFIKIHNQDAAIAYILTSLQLVCKTPRRNAKIVDLSADL